MSQWIAFLRGVNVMGANKLPMQALVPALEALGLSNVRTYLQSGNVVFHSRSDNAARLAARIGAGLHKAFDLQPQIMLISAQQLIAAHSNNPFPNAANAKQGATLHFYFLAAEPRSIDRDRLEAARAENERWKIVDRVFYLHTPDGFAQSKLRAQVEKALGVSATARNWRTVNALINLTAAPAEVHSSCRTAGRSD